MLAGLFYGLTSSEPDCDSLCPRLCFFRSHTMLIIHSPTMSGEWCRGSGSSDPELGSLCGEGSRHLDMGSRVSPVGESLQKLFVAALDLRTGLSDRKGRAPLARIPLI